MMMRAQTNMQTAVNRPLRERLGSLILGQSLTVWGRLRAAVYLLSAQEPQQRCHCRYSPNETLWNVWSGLRITLV